MADSVQRMGDSNSGGGVIDTIPQRTVFVNNLLAAVVDSKGTGHFPCPKIRKHCKGAWKTSRAAGSVYIENRLVVTKGDTDTCGHTRVGGSPNTFVGR